ncbi:hypothetical protein ACHAPM_011199 [Fusarium culmorum]
MPSISTPAVPRATKPSLTLEPQALGEHNHYRSITTNPQVVEVPPPSATLDPEEDPRLFSMTVEFLDQSSASLSILVHRYLSEEPFTESWKSLHSWISSMPKPRRLSKLGFLKLAYGKNLLLPLNLDEADEKGRTLLHEAVIEGFKDDVQVLLENGARPNLEDMNQKSPLNHALEGDDEIFVLLFEAFCEKHYATDPKFADRSTFANHYARCIKTNKNSSAGPLDQALIYAIDNARIGVVKLLLDENADPNCLDDKHIPALHHAILLMSKSFTSMKGKDITNLLLMRGSDPSIKSKDERRESCLHIAARLGAVELVRKLVGYGADPCAGDAQGRSVLFDVIEASSIDELQKDYLLRWLLLNGADVEQQDHNGCSVLHLTAKRGMQRVVLRLLKGIGAPQDPKDCNGETPYEYALKFKHKEVAALLNPSGRT